MVSPPSPPSLSPCHGVSPLGLQASVELGVIFLIQEVQGVVAGQATDGELVGHLRPLLPVAGHPLIELRCLWEEVLEQPMGENPSAWG